MLKIINLSLFLFFTLWGTYCIGQNSMLSANLGYGFYKSGRDLNDRFGNSNGMNVSLEKSFNKGNSISVEYILNFGTDVKEDVLAPFRNENGFVIGTNGLGAFAYLRMRSNYAGLSYGQPLYKKNKGLKISLGGGLFSHYIRVIDDSRNLVLADQPYNKGLDRLTNGWASKQELIYEYHGEGNNYHFNIGFSILEGFTNPVRKINFDTGTSSPNKRLDLLYGLKATWMIPILKSRTTEVKYY
jgi:hypothetical protein